MTLLICCTTYNQVYLSRKFICLLSKSSPTCLEFSGRRVGSLSHRRSGLSFLFLFVFVLCEGKRASSRSNSVLCFRFRDGENPLAPSPAYDSRGWRLLQLCVAGLTRYQSCLGGFDSVFGSEVIRGCVWS